MMKFNDAAKPNLLAAWVAAMLPGSVVERHLVEHLMGFHQLEQIRLHEGVIVNRLDGEGDLAEAVGGPLVNLLARLVGEAVVGHLLDAPGVRELQGHVVDRLQQVVLGAADVVGRTIAELAPVDRFEQVERLQDLTGRRASLVGIAVPPNRFQ